MDALILNLNKRAMDCLRVENYSGGIQLLQEAEEKLIQGQVQNRGGLWALTLNNLGDYYKRTSQTELAYHYFTKALETESNSVNSASILLNICSLKASSGNHSKALVYGERALSHLSSLKDNNAQTYAVIAHFNIAVAHEALHHIPEALFNYQKGLKLASRCLPRDSPLIGKLKACISGIGKPRTKLSVTPTRVYERKRVSRTAYSQRRKHSKNSFDGQRHRDVRVRRAPQRPDSYHKSSSRCHIDRKPIDISAKISKAECQAQEALVELKNLQRERERLDKRAQVFLEHRHKPLDTIPEN